MKIKVYLTTNGKEYYAAGSSFDDSPNLIEDWNLTAADLDDVALSADQAHTYLLELEVDVPDRDPIPPLSAEITNTEEINRDHP